MMPIVVVVHVVVMMPISTDFSKDQDNEYDHANPDNPLEIELKSKIEAINTRNQERREVETKKRQEEIKFLKYQETHLSKFLKSVSDNNK